jgi:hypothetical protein
MSNSLRRTSRRTSRGELRRAQESSSERLKTHFLERVRGPSVNGVPDVAYVTEEEFGEVASRLDREVDIQRSLREHATRMREWRDSDDTTVKTSTNGVLGPVGRIVTEVTGRADTSLVGNAVCLEYIKRLGWF